MLFPYFKKAQQQKKLVRWLYVIKGSQELDNFKKVELQKITYSKIIFLN
jgi:hypothetical protein